MDNGLAHPLEVRTFKVRAWPPPDPRYREIHRAPPEDPDPPYFDALLDRVDKARTVQLFDEPSWRDQMRDHCDGSDDKAAWDSLTADEIDDKYEELEEDMRSGEFGGDDPYAAERLLLAWLAEHDVNVLELLIDEGLVHTGEGLFTPFVQEWQFETGDGGGGGESETLLCIAAKDACSPRAVRMLLDKGADPNTEFIHLTVPFATPPTCGPGGLALSDIRNAWSGSFKDKMEILTLLVNAGGEAYNAMDMYKCQEYEEETEFTSDLFIAECNRASAAARTRFENVVALCGIISFWRHIAAVPTSRAAKKARLRFESQC
jgi:hypothetical protein